MDLPGIVFFFAGLVSAGAFIKGSLPYFSSRSRLEKALQECGLKSFVRDRGLKWRMLANRAAIFSNSDTHEIRALKQEIVDALKEMDSVMRRVFVIMLIGLALSIGAAMVEQLLIGKR